MANSVDPNQTAPKFAADDFSRRHFSDAFFLAALRVNVLMRCI